ncbi:MAG: DUF1932 domain-containing protein [Rhizobiaceae bacterium]
MSKFPKITFIGFGEAAGAIANGWKDLEIQISAFDIKTNSDTTRVAMLERYAAAGINGHNTIEEAVADADLIISLVTADQAHKAAKSVLGHCNPNAIFFDCNSCSPDTKRSSAKHLEADDIRYIDVAIMAPIYPAMHKTKLHISGPHEKATLEVMALLQMNVIPLEGDVGTASSVKMMRSIMIKGIEAVMMETILSARKAGVDELVLDSLDTTYPNFNFREKATFQMERVMVHGVRRAAEMREVALTVKQLGLDNSMATATVNWQQDIGERNLDPDYSLADNDYGSRADIILTALENTKEDT